MTERRRCDGPDPMAGVFPDPGRGVKQSRGAGSAPIPIPAVSTTAQRCGVSLCLCGVSLCLVPPLFIAIYCLFIILPTTTPKLYLLSSVPLGPRGSRLLSRPQSWHRLPPGLACPVASKRCPLWCPCPGEWGTKGSSAWLRGGSGSPGSRSVSGLLSIATTTTLGVSPPPPSLEPAPGLAGPVAPKRCPLWCHRL